MSADFAEQYPVLTFASGPTNSMRGAAFLSGLKDAMVVDVGGTTSDVGALTHGFPREASVAVDIGGVRTNFRMPDVYSFGLGGGSLVKEDPLTVGPQSVGYRLTEKALVFGGDTLTTTDIAVAAGVAEIGDASPGRAPRWRPGRSGPGSHPGDGRGGGRPHEDQRRTGAGDRRRRRQHPDCRTRSPGASEMVKPDHFEAANAVGAAIAQISGEVDRVYALESRSPASRPSTTPRPRPASKPSAAGADPATVQIVDVEDVPLAYLPGNATRIRVKAVGDLTL